MRQRIGGIQLRVALVSALIGVGCSDSSDPSPSGSTVSSVAFAESNITVSQGELRTLALVVKDANGTTLTNVSGVQWATNSAAVLTVTQSGEIRGVSLGGPVSVTATIDGLSATATVTVIPARVAFTPLDSNIVLGTTLQLSGTMLDYVGAPIAGSANVAWASSNPGVATIGASSGLLTGVASGETSISATSSGRTSTRTFRVGVPGPYDGRWSGISAGADPSRGSTVTASFEVIFGRVYNFELKLSHAFVTNAGIQLNCPFNASAPALTASTIANDAFTTTVPSSFGPSSTVLGTFTSPTTLSGTHTAMVFAGPAVCGMIGGTSFTTSLGVGASTWTATKAP